MTEDHTPGGIIQRDLLKLLAFLDSGKLEGVQAQTQIITLMSAVCARAYLAERAIADEKLIKLFGEIVEGFDPEGIKS